MLTLTTRPTNAETSCGTSADSPTDFSTCSVSPLSVSLAVPTSSRRACSSTSEDAAPPAMTPGLDTPSDPAKFCCAPPADGDFVPAIPRAAVRLTPTSWKAVDRERVGALYASELAKYQLATRASRAEIDAASRHIPLGVCSSFQVHDPYPLAITEAHGAALKDVDGRELVDFSMGFGALLIGHLHPRFVHEVNSALTTGTLFVMATPVAREAAESLCKRFGLEQVRFANSGTEATMYAVRVARAFTGRRGVVKVEGGYHGSYDALAVSAKPPLSSAGPPDAPLAVATPWTEPGEVHVVPYNDLPALERVLCEFGDSVACFVVEPVIQNLAIVLPDAGYLEGVRALCDKYGVLLIFDEVKTGLTAGPNGAAARLGVRPDLMALAKSIGGGAPLAAFGGRADVMEMISNGSAAHFGTFNGNPLALAAWRAVDAVCTPEALAAAEELNASAMSRLHAIIEEYELPAHVVGFGVKGCVTWSPSPVRDYRDWKATDFVAAELAFLWWLNRGVVTPPGLDDQWLVSLQHTPTQVDRLVEAFRELAAALRA